MVLRSALLQVTKDQKVTWQPLNRTDEKGREIGQTSAKVGVLEKLALEPATKGCVLASTFGRLLKYGTGVAVTVHIPLIGLF